MHETQRMKLCHYVVTRVMYYGLRKSNVIWMHIPVSVFLKVVFLYNIAILQGKQSLKLFFPLGFVNHCMENLFLDQSFWLYSQEEEETGIEVCINEKSLNLMYRSLLVQEGKEDSLCKG